MKYKHVLIKALSIISVPDSKLKLLENVAKDFKQELSNLVKDHAKAIIGGSFAKQTMINKPPFDVDIFIAFNKNISNIQKKFNAIMRNFLNSKLNKLEQKYGPVSVQLLHGSRDYYRIALSNDVVVEIVPIYNISKANQAVNITDVSPLHVKYVRKKIKQEPKLINHIKLAKAFFYANDCYGAESHLQAFSGYAIELLIIHYRNFINFCKAACKWSQLLKKKKCNKIFIDIENYYKNLSHALTMLNKSKTYSNIILIDPVDKFRNVTAVVSDEVLIRLSKACCKFLNRPSINFFIKKQLNIEKKVKQLARNYNVFLLEFSSVKQKQDVAAAKCKKFANYLVESLKDYKINFKHFYVYDATRSKACLVLAFKQLRHQLFMKGPPLKLAKECSNFKKRHKHVFIKRARLYCIKRINIRDLIRKLIGKAREMYISDVKLSEL